jgi:hypothetical protein
MELALIILTIIGVWVAVAVVANVLMWPRR